MQMFLDDQKYRMEKCQFSNFSESIIHLNILYLRLSNSPIANKQNCGGGCGYNNINRHFTTLCAQIHKSSMKMVTFNDSD